MDKAMFGMKFFSHTLGNQSLKAVLISKSLCNSLADTVGRSAL